MHQQTWWRAAWLMLGGTMIFGLLISLVACAPASTRTQTAGASTGTSQQGTSTVTSQQGTLNGLVVAGPACPVEQADQPCPPKPVPDRLVLIETPEGTIVARVTTNQQGAFTVMLSPGTYDLQVPPGPGSFPIQRMRQQVSIVAGQMVQVKIELDSGIR